MICVVPINYLRFILEVCHSILQYIENNKHIQLTSMFKGKVVLITGASTGIGAVCAEHFVKLGANLALCDKNPLDKVSSRCETISKSKPFTIKGDLSKVSDTLNIFNSAIKHYNKLDVLINNAGVLENGSIENTSLEQYDRVFNINVKSLYHLTMLAVPHLIKSKGTIVNVSSVNGLRSFPGLLAYNMSKSAVDQFTRCLALELASKQIRVNSVNPGVIVTELHKTSGMDEESYKKFLERTKEVQPLGRAGQPEEVADAIVYLASEHSSFITGVNLPVDGGKHVTCPR